MITAHNIKPALDMMSVPANLSPGGNRDLLASYDGESKIFCRKSLFFYK